MSAATPDEHHGRDDDGAAAMTQRRDSSGASSDGGSTEGDETSPRLKDKGKAVDYGEVGASGGGREERGEGEEEEEEEGDDDEDEEEDDDDDDDDDEDEDEEPRLKYARLTHNLGGLYRNGDATSTFLVAGDKMIVGTHNGNIHVFQLPTLQPLRVYHAHSASVTAISISPLTPPLPNLKMDQIAKMVADGASSPSRPASSRRSDASPVTSPGNKAAARNQPPPLANIPSNNIYIATASTDGNVCVQSLLDVKDVQLRNFGRPVQAVALSPDYRQDRTYLSGGLAGNLILTVGGQPGRSTSTTVGTAAAAASGWLGSIGLGANSGKDTVLHSGEGTISTIRWSLSGKYAVWLNEHGIKIMRTKLHLESADAESAWKRIGHIDRPQTEEWDTMAGVWKGRTEWIDEQTVDADDDDVDGVGSTDDALPLPAGAQTTQPRQQQPPAPKTKSVERLLVGWGSIVWIIHVHPGGIGVGKHAGERSVGRAEIVKILRMDCLISGLALYTQNLLLVLAHCSPDPEDDEEQGGEPPEPTGRRRHRPTASTASSSSEPSGGIRRRQNNQPPELRLIDLVSQAEVDRDVLTVSRFERLSASDYHLGVLPARTAAAAAAASSKGALEAIAGLGADMWNAAINPKMLFSSGQSIRSKSSNDGAATSSSAAASAASTASTFRAGPNAGGGRNTVHPSLSTTGIKIFMHSPYDCILATKRDLADHLSWLLEHEEYQTAWELVDKYPEAVPTAAAAAESLADDDARPAAAAAHEMPFADDFFSDAAADAKSRADNAPAEREKRRIGELWIKELVDGGDWARAGQVAGKVLRTADRWEKWFWTFARADKFDEVVPYLPTAPLHPPVPRTMYEIVLGRYLQTDKPRFRALLARWPTELFDVHTMVTTLENQLRYRDVRADSVEGGERGRDWRIVLGALAMLHEASGRYREALKCHIRLQDADAAFRLIHENHLADAVVDDIPGFLALRVPADRADGMTAAELEAATAEAITVLVDEAQHGLVQPGAVVAQLQKQELHLYTFLYFRGLWHGDGLQGHHAGASHDRLVLESKTQLDAFADLAVHLFARFDRALLKDFLKSSTAYSFEKAAAECERSNYIEELVYLYSKTGQMKRALYLIIDQLGDVSQAIAFAKEQDDPDLWEDLLNYSMDKPRFIRGLLEEVGTAIDPITLVRRIPEGLEIEGLRDGLKHIMKEHEIQHSISLGAARVLHSEVAAAQAALRSGQRRGIKFAVGRAAGDDADKEAAAAAASSGAASSGAASPGAASSGAASPGAASSGAGRCARCGEAFSAEDADTLVGFACGHVFHLGHLLGVSRDEAARLGFSLRGEPLHSRRHILSTKITHARLLRDRVRDGCPVCAGVHG